MPKDDFQVLMNQADLTNIPPIGVDANKVYASIQTNVGRVVPWESRTYAGLVFLLGPY